MRDPADVSVFPVWSTLVNGLPTGQPYEETTFDPHGRAVERVDYEGHTTVYRYYKNAVGTDDHFMSGTPLELLGIPGQLRVEENYIGTPGGNPDSSIVYEYDKLGRKIKETMTPGTNEVYLTQYDAEGRILILESPQGDLYYEYDPQTGRKVSTASYPSTMTFAQILADATATPTPFTSSVTRTVYTYDDLGRLETVQVVRRNSTDVSETATTYAYNDNGSQEKVIYPNGNEVVYEYDALNRLYRLTNYKSSSHLESELLSRFEYSCFADGQRATAEETYKGWKEENSIVQEVYLTREMAYRYDGLGRLIWEQRNDHDPNSFRYDLVGNRVSQVIGGRSNEPDVTTHYGYNALDQLQWEGVQSDGSNPTITYLYDYNGSLTSQTEGTATTAYVYDLRNRLVSVTADSITTTYGYSPDGIRVRRQVGTETPTVYLVDPMNLTGYSQVLQETTGSNMTTYTLGGDVIAQADESTVRFLIYDGHGSVRNHANSTGALVWFDIQDKVYKQGQPENDTKLLTYDAWGRECNGLSGDGLYYTGEMYDTKLSMYNLRARWYSPAAGRFNALDPYAGSSYDPQTLHKYLYCHANPINGIDPSGRFSIAEVSVNMAVSSILTKLALPIIEPAAELIASPIVLDFFSAFEGFLPTAWVIGGGYNKGFSLKGIPMAGGVNLEYVRSLSNGNSAWYIAPNIGLSSQGNSSSVSVLGGFVWGANSSYDYTQGFITISAPYKKLPRKVQRFVDGMLLKIGTKMLLNTATDDMVDLERFNLNNKIEEFKRQIAHNMYD